MLKNVKNRLQARLVPLIACVCLTSMAFGQTTPYPAPSLDQSIIPPSPNA